MHACDYPWGVAVDSAGNVYVPDGNNHRVQKFGLMPGYTLTITATAGGTTDPPPGSHIYDAEAIAVVSATPDTDYSFDYWKLDGINVGATNPISVTMDQDHYLHAVFVHVGPGVPEFPGADISIVAAIFAFLPVLYFTLKRKKRPHPTATATSCSRA